MLSYTSALYGVAGMDPQTNWIELILVTFSVIYYSSQSANGGRAYSSSPLQPIMKSGTGCRRVHQQELEAVFMTGRGGHRGIQ